MANINPIPIGQTAAYMTEQQLASYTSLEAFPEYLAAMQTVIVYIDPNSNVFHLNGALAGMEGVRLGEQMQGEQHIPFEQVLIEGAFQLGATIQRTNITKRQINFRVTIGGPGMNNYAYRMCEERWWAGQIESSPGWLGMFTRLSGWRWTQVWPASTVDTAQTKDPVAYGNNFAVWDINWLAPNPYYYKPARYATWKAATAGPANSDGYYTGNIVLANAADVESYVYYQINGAGLCQLQDNNSTNMVTLPTIVPTDGVVLCQTDPSQQTLIAQNDPQDNLFYDFARQAGILNYFLSGVDTSDQPIWQRGYTRFLYSVPPQTAVHFTVGHSNPNATITAFLPQRYRRGR
jgi:hypothetical protein